MLTVKQFEEKQLKIKEAHIQKCVKNLLDELSGELEGSYISRNELVFEIYTGDNYIKEIVTEANLQLKNYGWVTYQRFTLDEDKNNTYFVVTPLSVNK